MTSDIMAKLFCKFSIALISCTLCFWSTQLFAASISLQAGTFFGTGGSFAATSDLNFGFIDYTPTHTGRVRIHPNGNVTTHGASGLEPTGGHTAGYAEYLQNTGNVEISCTQRIWLADTNGNRLRVNQIRLSFGTPQSWGNSERCRGTGTVIETYDLTADPAHLLRIYVGGQLRLNNDAIVAPGTYNSSNPSGQSITIQVTVI